jgi:hypothetical protein
MIKFFSRFWTKLLDSSNYEPQIALNLILTGKGSVCATTKISQYIWSDRAIRLSTEETVTWLCKANLSMCFLALVL